MFFLFSISGNWFQSHLLFSLNLHVLSRGMCRLVIHIDMYTGHRKHAKPLLRSSLKWFRTNGLTTFLVLMTGLQTTLPLHLVMEVEEIPMLTGSGDLRLLLKSCLPTESHFPHSHFWLSLKWNVSEHFNLCASRSFAPFWFCQVDNDSLHRYLKVRKEPTT